MYIIERAAILSNTHQVHTAKGLLSCRTLLFTDYRCVAKLIAFQFISNGSESRRVCEMPATRIGRDFVMTGFSDEFV